MFDRLGGNMRFLTIFWPNRPNFFLTCTELNVVSGRSDAMTFVSGGVPPKSDTQPGGLAERHLEHLYSVPPQLSWYGPYATYR